MSWMVLVAMLAAGGPRRGDSVRLEASYGHVPALDSPISYREFLAAVKADDRRAMQAAYRRTLWLIRPGEEVEVVSAADGPIPASPGAMPALVVQRRGGGAPLWVPACYAHPGRDAYPAEARFPVLVPAMARAGTSPGVERLIAAEGGEDAPVALDADAYAALERAWAAKDREGVKAMVDAGRAARVGPETTCRVIGRVEGARAFVGSEVRVADGPLAGRVAFVMDVHLAAPALKVGPREARRKR